MKVIAVGDQKEPSAHPGSPNFDEEYATSVMGEVAEKVRGFLASSYKVKPPGLQTIPQSDGSVLVLANSPREGIGIQILVSLLPTNQNLTPPPQPSVTTPASTQAQQQTPQPAQPQNWGVGPQGM